ncbi:hypothetical protein RHECNPAF_2940019 [Rhizobium etli CNPAF512]|nr:hypothetical protein RHECNPAF_2940019 [Rhizobium etli CNPAF512]
MERFRYRRPLSRCRPVRIVLSLRSCCQRIPSWLISRLALVRPALPPLSAAPAFRMSLPPRKARSISSPRPPSRALVRSICSMPRSRAVSCSAPASRPARWAFSTGSARSRPTSPAKRRPKGCHALRSSTSSSQSKAISTRRRAARLSMPPKTRSARSATPSAAIPNSRRR